MGWTQLLALLDERLAVCVDSLVMELNRLAC
jgi:hypothetical protein